MADDKRRIKVELVDPDDERKTFEVPLRRFTPANFEAYNEKDMDVQEDTMRALEEFSKEENVPSEMNERIDFLRRGRRVAARARIVGAFKLIQWMIDTSAIKVEKHRNWVEEDPEAEDGFWHHQPLDEVEARIRSFRELLGVKA